MQARTIARRAGSRRLAALSACRQAAPRAAPSAAHAASMSSIKDMLVRAAVDHVTSTITTNNGRSAGGLSHVQDAEDADTWRAIVNTPVVASADNVDSADLYPLMANNDLLDVLDLTGHPGATATDPFAVVSDDMAGLNANIKRILGVDHPVLSRVAKYFFDFDSGKKIRPAMVLLMGRAVNTHMAVVNEHVASAGSDSSTAAAAAGSSRPAAPAPPAVAAAAAPARSAAWSPAVHDPTVSYATDGMPEPLARALAERAARMAASTAVATSSSAGSPNSVSNSGSSADAAASAATAAALAATSPQWAAAPLPPAAVFPLQARLAEVTEMIHTASLLHDDVIDVADTRRGLSSANSVFGNKLAVLAGDFLLARASVSLARLRSIPVVELLSTVIEHLVKGEVMQMKSAATAGAAAATREAFEMYLRKTYYKTGSLMANSCKAIAMLGCYPDYVCTAAFRYGLHVGVAFQLIDDLLDFEGTAASLGKPALADIKSGLATAPVLFAAQQYPVLLPLIERKFEAPGDVESTLRFVAAADGLAATRRLAIAHGQLALDALAVLAPSPERTALASLVSRVLNRSK